MSETLTIVLKADGSGLTGTVRASAEEVRKFGVAVDSSGKQTTAAGERSRRAARDVDALGRSSKDTSGSVSGLARGLGSLTGILGALGITMTVRGIAGMADTWSDLTSRVRLSIGPHEQAGDVMSRLSSIARSTYSSMEATTESYVRNAVTLRALHVPTAAQLDYTEALNNALVVSGAKGQAFEMVQNNLSKAMATGSLRGEELNTVLNSGSRVAELLAEELGVNVTELRGVAAEGKITGAVIFNSLTKNLQRVREEAESMPATIRDGMVLIRNAVLSTIGVFDQQNRVSETFAEKLVWIADNMDGIVRAVVTMGKIVAAVYAAQLIRSGLAWVANLNAQTTATRGLIVANRQWAATTVGSFTAARASIGLLGIASNLLMSAWAGWQLGTHLRKEFLVVEQGGIALVSQLHKAANMTKNVYVIAWGVIKAAALTMFNEVADRAVRLFTTLAEIQERIPGIGVALSGVSRGMAAAASAAKVETESVGETFQRLSAQATKELQDIEDGYFDLFEAAAQSRVETEQGTEAAGDFALALDGVSDSAAKTTKDIDDLRRAQAEFARANDRLAADLDGDLAVALHNYTVDMEDAAAAHAAGEASAAELQRRQELLGQQFSRTTDEIRREQDVMSRVAEDYDEAIRLMGMSSEARRVEEEAIRRVAAVKHAGRTMSAAEEEDLRRLIALKEREMTISELQAAAAEQYERMWDGAIDSVGAAFGDFATRGIKTFSDFGDALKDIARRFMSDIIREFTSTQLKRALAGWGQQFASMMSGTGTGNGGGLMKSVLGMFTGGSGAGSGGGMLSGMYNAFTSGFTSAGTAGGGLWSSLVSGFTGAVSSFTGSLGLASTATTAYGSAISGLASTWGGVNTAGAAVSGYSVGTAGVGAAAGVSWIPIVGWIVAGIMASSAAFKGGWDMQGQKTDISKWMLSKGNLGGAIDNAGVSLADNFLKAIGFSDSWAAAFSGSGLQTKLFGHKKPKVEGQGIQGSIGFSGIDGESYADIKAKGGWFRSDKKWTETGAMDSTIARAFDNASMAISMRSEDLAKQMGVDITAALAKVSIDLGKIEFDKDPEKARQQITDRIGEVMEDLSAEAVKALGFVRLLDDGFAASEIMGALSASIVLVTGGVDRLGKSLSALEIEHVARSVEYFEAMAIKNGSSLGDQIARTVGLLDEYASLITDVDTQLQTRDLNQYQSAQLQIELQYRSQVKSANQLAKALGLTGARAEDLAKIEQLRAVNMASLQTQMEAQKNTFLEDLGLGDLSTLRDDQKLVESMQLLRDAVGAGDMQRAQQLAQQSLGFGRNLYASGTDYSSLYGEVTGMIDGMTPATMEGFNDEQLDRIASLLEGLPQGIASAMFQLIVAPPPPVAPITPWTPPTPVNPGAGGGGGSTDQLLQQINEQLRQVAANTGGQLEQGRSAALHERNNIKAPVR